MTVQCKNCEHHFQGNFCPNCSQSAHTHRFTFTHLTHEVIHSVSHFDTGALYLIKQLAYRPGIVAAEYAQGKRKRYFNPITLLLLLLALQVMVSNWTNIYVVYQRKINEVTLAIVSQTAAGTPERKEKVIKKAKENLSKGESDMKTVVNSSKLINFVFLPVLAFLTWVFFRRSGYNYAENLVFNIFLASGVLIYFLFFCVPIFLVFPSGIIWIMTLYMIISMVYSIIAYKQFFRSPTIPTIFKGVAVQLISMITVAALTSLIMRSLPQ